MRFRVQETITAAAPLVWSETSPRRTALFAHAVVLARDVAVSHQATGSPLLPAMGHGVTLRARVSLQNKGQMRSQKSAKISCKHCQM